MSVPCFYNQKYKTSGWYLLVTLLLAAYAPNRISAKEPAHPHLHSEVKLVGYNGPVTKEVLTLFKAVEKLEFIDCHVTSNPRGLYSLLPNLKIIRVENTTIENLDHANVMEDANSVEEIYFINNNVDKIDLKTAHNLPRLKVLVIKHLSNPQKVIPSFLFQQTKLKVFEFSDCGIESIEKWAFNGSETIESLNLANNKLKSLPKEALVALENLKTLDLHGNQFDKFNANMLPELPNLESLNLSKNPLTGLNLDGLEKVAPKLKTLKIRGTPITSTQLKELKEKTKVEIVE